MSLALRAPRNGTKVFLLTVPIVFSYRTIPKRTKIKIRTANCTFIGSLYGPDYSPCNCQQGLSLKVESTRCYYFPRIGTCGKKTLLVVAKTVEELHSFGLTTAMANAKKGKNYLTRFGKGLLKLFYSIDTNVNTSLL